MKSTQSIDQLIGAEISLGIRPYFLCLFLKNKKKKEKETEFQEAKVPIQSHHSK